VNPGSGWVFPVTRDGVANVGVGVMLYHAQRDKINLHRFYDTLLYNSYHVAPKMRNARADFTLCAGRYPAPRAGRQQNRMPRHDPCRRCGEHDQSGQRRRGHLRAGDWRDGGEPHPRQPDERQGFPHQPGRGFFPQRNWTDRYQSYFRLGTLSVKWGKQERPDAAGARG
jgi:hypothetical protein